MIPDGGGDPDRVTVHLGQFTDGNAHQIAELLEDAGIHHWAKTTGRFARIAFAGDWGTHLFVDADRVDEARSIAVTVAS